MKTIRPLKRSVSPFAVTAEENKFLSRQSIQDQAIPLLEQETLRLFGAPSEFTSTDLRTPEDLKFLPLIIQSIAEAPANDAPKLGEVCRFLILFQNQINEMKLGDAVYNAMAWLFQRKTELFLIDHYDQSYCEKMGWQENHRDMVLYSKERDILVGCYFAPIAELQPGLFSEFIGKWVESENKDSLLHFLDFAAGAKNPTFEHYLLFTHPSLSRIVRDKTRIKMLFEKIEGILPKLSSPTWEKETRTAFGL